MEFSDKEILFYLALQKIRTLLNSHLFLCALEMVCSNFDMKGQHWHILARNLAGFFSPHGI